MILTRIQCRRFFKLFDPLTVYANECLDAVDGDELFSGGVRGIDESAQAKVAYELWENLPVIDKFVEENPAGFSFGELETVKSWRDGLTGEFVVWRFPDGVIRFMNGGYAFEVSGLSKEIEGMLHDVPTAVHTTLLPFDGIIVYSEYLSEMSVHFGEGMKAMFQESADEIASKGSYVASADGLLHAAARIREAELAHDLEELADDLAREEAPDEPVVGQHRGVLAGLDDDERDRLVSERFRKETSAGGAFLSGKGLAKTLLDERCTPGPVKTSLVDLLADMPEIDGETLDEVFAEIDIESMLAKYEEGDRREYAREYLEKGLAEMRAGLNATELVRYLTDADNLQMLAFNMNQAEAEAFRDLVERGGRMSVPADGLESLRDLPTPHRGLCYAFLNGDVYEFVVPDEIMDAARQVDWDAVADHARKHAELVNYFDQLVELRGIVAFPDAVADYLGAVPDGFTDLADVNDELMTAIDAEEIGLHMLDDGDEIYLVHYELIWERREALGKDPYEAETMEKGPIGSLLEGLLRAQEGKAPRIPSPEMLAEESLFYWKEKQPPVRAMRRFLDANVPDSKDDYYFADKVLESLIDETKWGGSSNSATYVFEVLEENDFIPDKAQMQTLLNLWMNMCNGLPVWANNGWSPAQLASSDPERPLFFNEDGSLKKVGRNDPCPCGSGKKYKKCCGR